jgi:hypothetical protein
VLSSVLKNNYFIKRGDFLHHWYYNVWEKRMQGEIQGTGYRGQETGYRGKRGGRE